MVDEADQGASDIVQRVAGGDGALSAMEAARSLVDARRKQGTAGEAPPDGAPPLQNGEEPSRIRRPKPAEAMTEQELLDGLEKLAPQGSDATAQETGPGETTAEDGAQETEPPVDPPRSWTKEDKELFRSLPRETQERVAERERSRERDFLKRQNEASERTKGLSAKEQEAERVKQQYEQAIPLLLQQLQEGHAGEFADVQSIADIERLAREDWPRYVLWDAQQKKIAAVQQQVQVAKANEAQKQQQLWDSFTREQDALFAEKAPDLADRTKASAAANSAGKMLNDYGFSNEELNVLYFNGGAISFRDHRMQLLIRDVLRFREAKAHVTTAAKRPVPQVQRPGVAEPRGLDNESRIKELTNRLNQSGSARDAAALLVAQRQARAGR